MDKQFTISVARTTRILVFVAIWIIALDIAAMTFTMLSGHDHVMGLLGLVNLDGERGIGTLFQIQMLLSAAGLLFALHVAAKEGRAEQGPWLFLCFIFLFLTMDEFAFLHERTMPAMRALVGDKGILHFAWIVPYAIAVVVLAVFIAPKILRLSSEPRFFFIAAAVAYLSGALGMEALGGWRMDFIGGESARPELVYESITTVEESLEMTGLILLLRAILGMLNKAESAVLVRLAD